MPPMISMLRCDFQCSARNDELTDEEKWLFDCETRIMFRTIGFFFENEVDLTVQFTTDLLKHRN